MESFFYFFGFMDIVVTLFVFSQVRAPMCKKVKNLNEYGKLILAIPLLLIFDLS